MIWGSQTSSVCRRRWLGAALGAAAVLYQPAIAHGYPPPKESNATTGYTERGTQQFPLIVQQIPAQTSQAETQRQKEDRQHRQNVDDWMVWLTAGLVAVGLFQGGVTTITLRGLSHSKRAADAAKEAADAAFLNAQAIQTAERPHITVAMINLIHYDDELTSVYVREELTKGNFHPPFRPSVKFGFTNFGKGPAQILDIGAKFYVSEHLPYIADYGQHRDVIGVWNVTGGVSFERYAMFDQNNGILDYETSQAVREAKLHLRFAGMIKYRDFFGTNHITRCAYRYVIGGGIDMGKRWEPEGDAAHWEYT